MKALIRKKILPKVTQLVGEGVKLISWHNCQQILDIYSILKPVLVPFFSPEGWGGIIFLRVLPEGKHMEAIIQLKTIGFSL